MATVTIRPDETTTNQNWTLSTGTTPHTLVNDDSDATYCQAQAGGWLLVFGFTTPTIPAYSTIKSVSVRVRRRGNSNAWLDVAIGYPPQSSGDSYHSIVLSSKEKPSSTILTKTYGSLVKAPGGAEWENSTILPNIQVAVSAADTNIRVYEVYLDVEYSEAPTCVVTSPLGEIVGTQVPAVDFAYSSPEDATQERARAKIFTDAQYNTPGFGPDTTLPFWDSGVVLTSAPSLTIGTPLPPDNYRVYVKAADAGSNGRFGPWATADFTMGGQLPRVPTLSAEVDNDNRRIALTVDHTGENRLSYGQSTFTADNGEGDGWYADENTVLDQIGTTAPTVTTLTDTFTGANGALAAGNTDIDWTVVAGAFIVNSNQLQSTNTELILPPAIRHNTALPSVDHYAKIQAVTLSTTDDRSCGVILRFDASSYTGYVVELNQQFNRFAVWKAINGAGYAISGFRPLPKTLALSANWKATISGSTISVYIQMSNDTDYQLLGQWTDTSITTGVRTGITMYNSNSISRCDNFEAGDLAPVVGGGSDSGQWLGEMTVTAARPGAMFTGGRYNWGTPVSETEVVTIMASAWQSANAVRDVALDAEFFADGEPLVNSVFEETFPTVGASWSGSWTSSHVAGGDDSVVATGSGRLTTGSTAFGSPARMAATSMASTLNSDVKTKMIFSTVAADVRGVVGVRGSNAWFFSSVYPNVGYFLEVVANGNAIVVRKGTGTALNGAGGQAHTILAAGVWVRIRARDIPDRATVLVQAKWWDADDDEPEAWNWQGEDATYFNAPGVLVCGAQPGTAAVRTVDFTAMEVDDLSNNDYGATWETTADNELSPSSRDVVVPLGATSMKLTARAFPTGASEVFVWAAAGVIPGSGQTWSRGGLTGDNMYGPNESSFENSAATTAGWEGVDDSTIARASYPSAASGAALEVSWDSSSGIPSAVMAAGPGKPATPGADYAVRALLWRVGSVDVCRIGIEFRDSSDGVVARSFATDVLPAVGLEFADSGSFSMTAPDDAATVHAVFAASALSAATSAAITAVRLVPGTEAPEVFRPGPLARAYARVEYTDDGGVTWELVRGTLTSYYGSDNAVLVYDYEAPPGVPRQYRAATAAADFYLDDNGGATVISEYSSTVLATLTSMSFWFRDPLVPARLLEIKHSGDLDQTSLEPQEIHVILSRENPVIVSDGVKGERFEFPLTFTSAQGWRQFQEMRRAAGPILFQSDFDGEQWFLKFDSPRHAVLKRSQDRPNTPVRFVEIAGNQIDRPAPEESNSGIVTQTVWNTV